MQTIEFIKEKHFTECQIIIRQLSEIQSIEDLISKKESVSQLQESISFLKILSETDFGFELNVTENQEHQPEENNTEIEFIDEEIIREEEFQEAYFSEEESLEVAENKEEISNDEIEFELIEEGFDEEILEEETQFLVEEPALEEQEIKVFEAIEEEKEDLVENFEILEKTEENLIQEEHIAENEIQTLENEEPSENSIEEINEEKLESNENQEKKIKLSSIKGLKNMSSLFEDDFFEEEKPAENLEAIAETNSSTSDFKLDLNDKLAFSKMLFGGSQLELNEVVKNLNSFDNLDDAKQYLSDMYYDKGWDKVDEYAQRLWILVENKFL